MKVTNRLLVLTGCATLLNNQSTHGLLLSSHEQALRCNCPCCLVSRCVRRLKRLGIGIVVGPRQKCSSRYANNRADAKRKTQIHDNGRNPATNNGRNPATNNDRNPNDNGGANDVRDTNDSGFTVNYGDSESALDRRTQRGLEGEVGDRRPNCRDGPLRRPEVC